MNFSRKIVLTGVVTLGVFALGSAGAAAVAHTLTIEDRTGAEQKIAPVTTGTTSPSPSASPFDDKSNDPSGTTTVAPAPPINVDDDGDVSHSGTDDGVAHDLGDDNGGDGSGGELSGQNTSGSGDSDSGTSGSDSTSGSGSGDSGSGSGSGSGHGGGSDDTGGHH